jgi:hypothetical protein
LIEEKVLCILIFLMNREGGCRFGRWGWTRRSGQALAVKVGSEINKGYENCEIFQKIRK